MISLISSSLPPPPRIPNTIWILRREIFKMESLEFMMHQWLNKYSFSNVHLISVRVRLSPIQTISSRVWPRTRHSARSCQKCEGGSQRSMNSPKVHNTHPAIIFNSSPLSFSYWAGETGSLLPRLTSALLPDTCVRVRETPVIIIRIDKRSSPRHEG